MQLNGAEIVIECLKEQGVDTVFGYPGGCLLYTSSYVKISFLLHIKLLYKKTYYRAILNFMQLPGQIMNGRTDQIEA